MPDDPPDLATLLGAYRIALLITRGVDGHLHCRPMAMRQKIRGEEILVRERARLEEVP